VIYGLTDRRAGGRTDGRTDFSDPDFQVSGIGEPSLPFVPYLRKILPSPAASELHLASRIDVESVEAKARTRLSRRLGGSVTTPANAGIADDGWDASDATRDNDHRRLT